MESTGFRLIKRRVPRKSNTIRRILRKRGIAVWNEIGDEFQRWLNGNK